MFRLHDEGAHGNHATFGPALLADERVACCCRAGNAAGANGPALREHARGGEVPQDHPRVAWVTTRGFRDKYHALAQKYCRKARGLLNFGVKGGAAAGVRFIEAAQFLATCDIGDAKTLIIHPASNTHRQMSDEDRLRPAGRPT